MSTVRITCGGYLLREGYDYEVKPSVGVFQLLRSIEDIAKDAGVPLDDKGSAPLHVDYECYPPEEPKAPTEMEQAQGLLAQITPVPGEVRVAVKCLECGNIHGRRYIPYAMGAGATFEPCSCILRGRPQTKEILRMEP